MPLHSPDDFERRYGFARRQVGLANWRMRPFSSWSFQNVSELVPCALVQPGVAPDDLVEATDLLREPVDVGTKKKMALGEFLAASSTDCFTVMKHGRVVADHAAPTCDPHRPHIVFSVSKSVIAILAGILQDRGLLDADRPVAHYLPGIGGAYANCAVRHLLDMRAGIGFDEADPAPGGPFERYRRVMLWNPGTGGETMLSFLASLERSPEPHGGAFRYFSPNTDLLGIVIEHVAGRRFPDLLREWLLEPLGATGPCLVTVDAEGTARAAGGIAMTARDLARIGELMRTGGMAGSRPLLSEAWVRDATGAGDREAWLAGEFAHKLPLGSYRSNWYRTGEPEGAFHAAGIHGQWLYVDPRSGTVIVRLSSEPQPVDEALDRACLQVYRQVAQMA